MFSKIVDTDNLGRAWQKVRVKKSGCGFDGKSISDFEKQAELYLAKLRDELLA